MTRRNTWADIKKRTVETATSCWEWQGFRGHKGYGQISYGNKAWAGHRLSWTLAYGPILEGMQVCHRCDNRSCINPEHLFLGTNRDNCLDMVAKKRHHLNRLTHCKRGHPLSGENMYRSNRGYRHCRRCEKALYRLKRGWPEHLAFSDIKIPNGYTWRDVTRLGLNVGV